VNPAKATALLNGKAQAFDLGLGGEPVTSSDIAHAIGMMWHPGARLYGRVKWAGQDDYFDPLLIQMVRAVKAVASFDAWNNVRPGELERLAKLALVEQIQPRLCGTCRGLGGLMVEKQKRGRPKAKKTSTALLKIICPKCQGEGCLPHSEKLLSRTAGIKRDRWENVWSERYHFQIVPIVEKWELLFWRGMRRALREKTA
jgi:hypothetical protein